MNRNQLANVLLTLSLSIATGTTLADERRAFKPKPIEAYGARQTIDGLTIAAEPFETEQKTREAFGKLNPNRYGILPVLVLMRNDSGKTVDLSRMRVEYVRPDGRRLAAIPPEEVPYYRGADRPRLTPRVPYPIPGRTGGQRRNPLEAEEIQIRAFSARMLPPGESAYGFFYFHTASHTGACLYIVGIEDTSTRQPWFYFEIPLNAAR